MPGYDVFCDVVHNAEVDIGLLGLIQHFPNLGAFFRHGKKNNPLPLVTP
jgi:hypothetical protein